MTSRRPTETQGAVRPSNPAAPRARRPDTLVVRLDDGEETRRLVIGLDDLSDHPSRTRRRPTLVVELDEPRIVREPRWAPPDPGSAVPPPRPSAPPPEFLVQPPWHEPRPWRWLPAVTASAMVVLLLLSLALLIDGDPSGFVTTDTVPAAER